ncbi:MAG TPA: hypothetical protein VFX50_13220 [Gemmatimonadales bacterium]|nr:hypothetical protein [Gemmatimonadales bacterium]
MSAWIEPWSKSVLPARPEPLLAALWRHRRAIVERVPLLPLPTYRPARTSPMYAPAPLVTSGQEPMPVNDGDPAGPGPDIHAAALITVWEHWAYASGHCHACRGPMVATFWGGIMGVGSVSGTCVECFARGGRFLPGFPTAMGQIGRILERTPWLLPWTPLAFRLGGRAEELRRILTELGETGLEDDALTPWEAR